MADQRLRRSPEIRTVVRAGTRIQGTTVVVHTYRRRDQGPARWTVIAGRRVGSAVRRNRAKRRLRAVLRAQPLPPGTDVVVVAKRAAVSAATARLEADVARGLSAVTPADGSVSADGRTPDARAHGSSAGTAGLQPQAPRDAEVPACR
jgi:ribonuclease P protein component